MRRAILFTSAISAFCSAPSLGPAHADAGSPVPQAAPMAVVDFSYVDTSGEPREQTAAHQKRLQTFMLTLRRDLAEKGNYRLVPLACAVQAFEVETNRIVLDIKQPLCYCGRHDR